MHGVGHMRDDHLPTSPPPTCPSATFPSSPSGVHGNDYTRRRRQLRVVLVHQRRHRERNGPKLRVSRLRLGIWRRKLRGRQRLLCLDGRVQDDRCRRRVLVHQPRHRLAVVLEIAHARARLGILAITARRRTIATLLPMSALLNPSCGSDSAPSTASMAAPSAASLMNCTCTDCNPGYFGDMLRVRRKYCTASSDESKTTGSDGTFYCINGGTASGVTEGCGCIGCNTGWEGDHCEIAKACSGSRDSSKTTGDDGKYYCEHGTVSGTTESCQCNCATGYDGTHCQTAKSCTPSSDQDMTSGANGEFYCINGGSIGGVTGSCTCTGL